MPISTDFPTQDAPTSAGKKGSTYAGQVAAPLAVTGLLHVAGARQNLAHAMEEDVALAKDFRGGTFEHIASLRADQTGWTKTGESLKGMFGCHTPQTRVLAEGGVGRWEALKAVGMKRNAVDPLVIGGVIATAIGAWSVHHQRAQQSSIGLSR